MDKITPEIAVEKYGQLPRLVVFSITNRTDGLTCDINDLIQEGYVKLIECTSKYNGSVKFETFASTCIRRHVYNIIKKERRRTVSLDYFDDVIPSSGTELEDMENEMVIESAKVFVKKHPLVRTYVCPDAINKIMDGLIDQETIEVIAKKSGKSSKGVYRTLDCVRKRAATDAEYQEFRKALRGESA